MAMNSLLCYTPEGVFPTYLDYGFGELDPSTDALHDVTELLDFVSESDFSGADSTTTYSPSNDWISEELSTAPSSPVGSLLLPLQSQLEQSDNSSLLGSGGAKEKAAVAAPRTKKRAPASQLHSCINCHTNQTPLWRRTDAGEYLCNACGIYYKNNNVHRKVQERAHTKGGSVEKRKRMMYADKGECSNCMTTTTTMWRQIDQLGMACNACGLYWKLHKQLRPLSMCQRPIAKRKRNSGTMQGRESPDASAHFLPRADPVPDVGDSYSSDFEMRLLRLQHQVLTLEASLKAQQMLH